MAGTVLKTGIVLVAVFATLFQVFLGDILWDGLALRRVMQPIGDFPYTCRRINDPHLTGCEDMWFSEETRQLFLACSDPLGRRQWLPTMRWTNWEGRSKIDAVIAMDVDKPEGDSFAYRVLSTSGYAGIEGDEARMYLLGINGADSGAGDGKVTIALVNSLPALDLVTGKLLDQGAAGGNATIEVFETGPEAKVLQHVRTFAGPMITMPNRPALAGSDIKSGLYVSNEHRERADLKSHFALFLPIGIVAFCDDSGCEEVADGFKFPNGIHYGRDGLLWVPTSGASDLHLYREVESGGDGKKKLEKVGYLNLEYPFDNLSEDANGDIIASVFPKPIDIVTSNLDPLHKWHRTTVFRIRKEGGVDGRNYTLVAEKILEDRDREVVAGATTVVHDVKTGRLFFSGLNTPFIAVCDPK